MKTAKLAGKVVTTCVEFVLGNWFKLVIAFLAWEFVARWYLATDAFYAILVQIFKLMLKTKGYPV